VRAASVAAVAACLACLALPPPAGADPLPAGSQWSDASLRSRDGTSLHADVFRPAGLTDAGHTPVVLVVSPYLGPSTTEGPGPPRVLRYYRGLYEEAIARGYSVVQVSFRGTGASQGCEDLGGRGEQSDVAAAIEWAATRPWSTGRVGMIGHSYDGFAAVVGLAQRPEALAAAVLMAPAIDLYRGAYMNGVSYFQGRAVGPYYQVLGLLNPAGRDLSCSAGIVSESQNSDARTAFWRERDFSRRAAGTRVPVLWAHGFLDGRDDFSAVRPSNFLDLWEMLAGPRRAWLGQFPHVVPGERNTWNEAEPVGRAGFTVEALDWLDAYVKGDPQARARVARPPRVAVQEGARGEWRSVSAWPPPIERTSSLPLLPGTYADAAGNKAEQGNDPGGGCAEGIHARCNPLSQTGQGTWTFSQPLSSEVQLAGVTRLRASLTSSPAAQVVAIVYDVDREGKATLLTRGASVIGAGGEVSFALYPQDWRLRAGHRIGVLLSGSDDFYFTPGASFSTVQVRSGSLSLPLLVNRRNRNLRGVPSRAVAERTSFRVSPELMGSRSARLESPPVARRPLTLRVHPGRVRARRNATLRIVARDGRRGVRAARVTVGGRLVRTGRGGVVLVRIRFVRAGRFAIRAWKPGHREALAWVRVVR